MKQLFFLLLFIPFFAQSQTDFAKAEQLFKQKKFDQAQVIFENLLKSDENNVNVIEYLGDIYANTKNWDKCIFYFKKLKNLKPNEPEYLYKYGGSLGMKASLNKNLASLKLVDEAKLSFEKALILNPKHVGARHGLIRLYCELPGIVGGSYKKANKYADELQKISPVDYYLEKGTIAEYQSNYNLAETHFLAANKIGKSKVTYQKLYDIYIKLKQPEKAKALEKN